MLLPLLAGLVDQECLDDPDDEVAVLVQPGTFPQDNPPAKLSLKKEPKMTSFCSFSVSVFFYFGF